MARPGEGKFGKVVRKNDYEPEYQRAREREQTERYAQIRKRHPAVERKINEVMNHQGGRRARYWGIVKVRCQQYMTVLTVNAKRMVKLLLRGERPAHA
jgi:transposase